ncbi:hypothetical protein SAMN05660772_00585 [Pasteurella testudinis DSM 23072]|uniref:Lipoprotein n=1 Tax=Pasteurella testudinis DSM 23072 TaxID=1122938 RepID=A0A1W1UQZ2_9PAST|nr:hypothetical protein [Pasteurella testudinis]SMB83453.1 hypothetical protein SAMN05660772_00585 [Pasteurella testudinis DSM 23072]SUB51089.1 Uncharacterised protein [Pasteurella testudinis]
MHFKSYLLLVFALLMTACSATEPSKTFRASEKVTFNGKTFQRGKMLDLVEMVRYVYNPNGDGSSREKVVLFFDRNQYGLSLQQRLELRQKSYQQSDNTLAEMTITDDTLYSQLVYRPSERFAYWGVEVAKGRNMADCGFLEFQYSYGVNGEKQAKAKENAFLQQRVYPKAHKILQQLQQQPWIWQCD